MEVSAMVYLKIPTPLPYWLTEIDVKMKVGTGVEVHKTHFTVWTDVASHNRNQNRLYYDRGGELHFKPHKCNFGMNKESISICLIFYTIFIKLIHFSHFQLLALAVSCVHSNIRTSLCYDFTCLPLFFNQDIFHQSSHRCQSLNRIMFLFLWHFIRVTQIRKSSWAQICELSKFHVSDFKTKIIKQKETKQ